MRPIALTMAGIFALVAAAQAFPAAKATAATGTPSEVVRQLIDSMRKLGSTDDREQRRRIVDTVNRTLAIDVLARQALGPAWSQLDAGQRSRLVELMTLMMEKIAYPRAVEFFSGLEVNFRGEGRGDRGNVVRTAVTRANSGEVKIDYVLVRDGGRWRIVDIDLEGQSLSDRIGQQIQAILKQGSYDDLVERLEARLAEPSGGNRPGPTAPSAN